MQRFKTFLELTEATKKFTDLPKAWIQQTSTVAGGLLKGGQGGANSKVDVVSSSNKIKSAAGIRKLLKTATTKSDYLINWVEVDGKPIIAARPDSRMSKRPNQILMFPDGNDLTVDMSTARYTRKTSVLSSKDAVEEMMKLVLAVIDKDPDADWKVANGRKIEVLGLTVDEDRVAKQQDRRMQDVGDYRGLSNRDFK